MPGKSKFSVSIVIAVSVVFAFALSMALKEKPNPDQPVITVYKSATCGCCKKWISHLQQEGFRVKAVNKRNLSAIKKEHGIQPELESCHTALVDGFVVEGHVPADSIKKLLKDNPSIKGIAVPGMPIGSPGMEGPNAQPYKVLAFDASGKTTVFDTY